jgi:N-acetyl-1-D-myo-inositol-2-amino-2-deoxy-alpha-D-glucopyranoside deacetylase
LQAGKVVHTISKLLQSVYRYNKEDKMNSKTLVFIGAHPDDETFAVGGTLAQYAASGVRTYYVCATRGEAGVAPSKMKGFDSAGDMRWAELECAIAVLGLAGVVHLGYRDSGMQGWEDNHHPEAFIMAPVAEAAGRIVKIIRDLKPQVVVTHDPIGGYRHPDHIAAHDATTKAFFAAGDPAQYPEAGPAFQPQKLYYHIFSRGWLKTVVKLLPLIGQDPHKFGRNKDIDLAGLVAVDFPEQAVIRLTEQSISTREKARACHVSQIGDRAPQSLLWRIANKLGSQHDSYMRAYPARDRKYKEYDLFEGVV